MFWLTKQLDKMRKRIILYNVFMSTEILGGDEGVLSEKVMGIHSMSE